MTPHVFFLGKATDLCFYELQKFFPTVTQVSSDIAIVQDPMVTIDGIKREPKDLLQILGGTVKIAELIAIVKKITVEDIVKILSKEKVPTLTFGISVYGNSKAIPAGLSSLVKKELEYKGYHVRFVSPHDGTSLSSVVVKKQHVLEVNIISTDEGFMIARTVVVQDFEQWNMRDYGRPYADPKGGMLPPKVARIAVNLALGTDGAGKVVFDPFCGMGTVLSEALSRKAQVIGSDILSASVQHAHKNVDWLRKTLEKDTQEGRFFESDATHVSTYIEGNSVDAIVTEPFMGTTKLGEKDPKTIEQRKNIFKGLSKLYIGALREWHSLLKDRGLVVMAIPAMGDKNHEISVKKVIDRCEILGYTKLLGPLEYSRPQAVVRRQFYVLQKK